MEELIIDIALTCVIGAVVYINADTIRKKKKMEDSSKFLDYMIETIEEYSIYSKTDYMDYICVALNEFRKYGYLKKPLKLENYLPENFYENLKEYLEL
jgi:hypothetical protein